MSLVSKIGEAVLGEVHVEWNITDFFSLSDKKNDFYYSPSFSFYGAQWYLKLYPSGDHRNSSAESVGLYLIREDSGSPKTVYFTFGIKGSEGEEEKTERHAEFSKKEVGYGNTELWSRCDLKNRKTTLTPNNVLTITCDLRRNARLSAGKDENKLGKSLLSVLESKDDSDVVIKVQGKEFPAHRVILRARSPVFSSMFSHDMVEKKTNVVTIEDGDPETFPDFLVHIYSGSCEHISAKNVYSLYTAADKYDMDERKEACVKFMRRNITINCFCEVISLALKHGDKELIECATEFFSNNTLDIAKTAHWQTFLNENSTVGNELFMKTVSKYQNN